ncbi:phenylalanine--tRNA ligase subunit beta [Cerrena zonata]|uniref:Phenylalanine--tRNA ligase beta subunit n=1 Tax=Cerrena zonata TaxID=2478898 RepID=A0AAW0FVJ5_9APHY
MPTIPVDKADLFELLGKSYTTEEFDELCFEFGIELDEDTTEECQGDERPQLKIEVPANRYDMLCIEGIAQALNEFLGHKKAADYKLNPSTPEISLTIEKSTESIRPYAAGAILRNVEFDERRYNSFIALQDKLHTNLCRNRTLVAIGTHDFDTLTPPFTYRALSPKEIKFIPLNQTKELDGEELMEFYEKDKNLVTGTDRTKTEIVINQMIAMFSGYCKNEFEVEPIEIISEHNKENRVTPNITPKKFEAEIPIRFKR